MKYLIIFIFLMGFCLLSKTLILADETATVVATVQTELISLSVDTSTINYGLVPFNSFKVYPNTIVVTNTGNVSEDVAIRGSNATSQGTPSKTWELATTPDVNKFVHSISVDNPTDVWTPLSTTNPTPPNNFKGSMNPGYAANLKLNLKTPVSGDMGIFDTYVYLSATKH